MKWLMRYKVTADFRPYRAWWVSAESESEARLEISRKLNIPYEETSASLA